MSNSHIYKTLHTSISHIITFMYLADAFIQRDLECIQAIHYFISMCVRWELNPQPFALLMHCSTTEPHENMNITRKKEHSPNQIPSENFKRF